MKSLCFSICLVAVLFAAAHSATIAYEGVSYSGVLNGKGPATGFSGPWSADAGVNVSAATLSNTLALASTGGSVSGFFDFICPLTNTIAPGPGKEFWASFLLFHSGPNDQAYMGLSASGAVLGSLPAAAFGVRLGQYGVFVGGTFTASGKVFTVNGSTDLLVAHFVNGVGVWNVDLFVNPTSFAVPDLSTNVPAVTYGTVVNHNQAQFGSDEYRLGDNVTDVAAGVTPVVGESWGRIKSQYR